MTDTAPSAMDQHSLAGLEMPVVEEPLPCRQRGERHCCGFDVRETLRFGRGFVRSHEHVFFVAAAIDAAEHCIDSIAIVKDIYPSASAFDRPG